MPLPNYENIIPNSIQREITRNVLYKRRKIKMPLILEKKDPYLYLFILYINM